MRITPVALLAAVGVVSCAEGMDGPLSQASDPPAAATSHAAGTSSPAGTSSSAGTSPPAGTSNPLVPPAPTSTEVSGSYSLDVTCGNIPVLDICLLDASADKNVTFALPAGTRKSSIQYAIQPQGPDAGGNVDWASQDPLDATVHIHGFADAFSSVHIAVTGVTVVPD